MSDLLFSPLQVGALELKNRVVMAPLTRCRASEGRVPNALMAEYYAQRAGAGLILTEATCISPAGVGYPNTPGIWSEEQVAGWKLVTEAVHARGGKIALQLWHVGRISDPIYLEGELPVAPSAVRPKGTVSLVRPVKEFVTPRALTIEEIKATIEDYRKGAQNALAAGFDAVELHAANGYLIDQFLQSSTNLREDEYGGSLENRAKFLTEVTQAVIEVYGANRVGVHLAPRCDAHDMGDANPLETFSYAVTKLNELGVAFICTREYQAEDSLQPALRKIFKGTYIANEKLTGESAAALVESGAADAVAFGVPYIANPDLVNRLKLGSELNPPHPETFYGEGYQGYTDYPFLD